MHRKALKILSMPDVGPWPLSDGGTVANGYVLFRLIAVGCAMLLFFGTYPLVRLLLPPRTAADAAEAGRRARSSIVTSTRPTARCTFPYPYDTS